MREVVELNCETTLELPPDRVLGAAVDKLNQVLVLGYDKEGDEYFATSMTNKAEILWLVGRFRSELLTGKIG